VRYDPIKQYRVYREIKHKRCNEIKHKLEETGGPASAGPPFSCRQAHISKEAGLTDPHLAHLSISIVDTSINSRFALKLSGAEQLKNHKINLLQY
jgi:hypothetical protein